MKKWKHRQSAVEAIGDSGTFNLSAKARRGNINFTLVQDETDLRDYHVRPKIESKPKHFQRLNMAILGKSDS